MKPMMKSSLPVLALSAVLFAPGGAARADATADAVRVIQQGWERITYQSPSNEHERQLEALAAEARRVAEANPGRAEPLIWEGIVISSLAGAKGGLSALGLVKQARVRYEAAMKIDDKALDGSAYNSLGVLFYKVPGWPIGFGDKKKADELLNKALKMNPDGIDPNYFYGDYLLETGRPRDALPYLERAVNAPSRPGRDVADKGRRTEAMTLLEKARAQM